MLVLNKEDFDELHERAKEREGVLDFMADLSAIRVNVDHVGLLKRGEVMDDEHPTWGLVSLAEWGKRYAEWDAKRMDVLLAAWTNLDNALAGGKRT